MTEADLGNLAGSAYDGQANGTDRIWSYVEFPPDLERGYYFFFDGQGDFNGDGATDLVLQKVQSWSMTPRYYPYLLYGGSQLPSNLSGLVPLGNQTRPYNVYGSAGDVNGDGYDDAVGRPPTTYNGEVGYVDPIIHVWHGGADGLPPEPSTSTFLTSMEDLRFITYGKYICPAGDLNGDGFDDILVFIDSHYVPDPSAPDGWRRIPAEYRAYYGSVEGLPNATGWSAMVNLTSMRLCHGEVPAAHADVDGDGLSDLVYVTNAYRAHVHYGAEIGLREEPDTAEHSDYQYTRFNVHAPLRLNDDGYDDAAFEGMGCYDSHLIKNWTNRDVSLKFGSRDGMVEHDSGNFTLPTWVDDSEWVRSSIEFLEVDGDGLDDLLVLHFEAMENPDPTPEERDHPTWGTNPTLDVHLNRGGTFGKVPDNSIELGWMNASGAGSPIVGDFDDDGVEDIAFLMGGYDYGYRSRYSHPEGMCFLNGRALQQEFTRLWPLENATAYARCRPYTLRVDVDPIGNLWNASQVRLCLDPAGANVTVGWSRGVQGASFQKVQDPLDMVEVGAGEVHVNESPYRTGLLLGFEVTFNWNWPHERMCDLEMAVSVQNGFWTRFLLKDAFRVENDLVVGGELRCTGEWQGALSAQDWVRANETLTFFGYRVVYEGTSDLAPPDGTCLLTLSDSSWRSSSAPWTSGVAMSISMRAADMTNPREVFLLSLQDLPMGAEARNYLYHELRIDDAAPGFSEPRPSSDQWQTSSHVTISTLIIDADGSGVDEGTVEYCVMDGRSGMLKGWTDAAISFERYGRMTRAEAVVVFPDGCDYYVRWRAKDLVGNGLAESPPSQVQVDTTPPTLGGPYHAIHGEPIRLEVLAGITVQDIGGSGVDVSTVQYRVSLAGTTAYGVWLDWAEGDVQDSAAVEAAAVVILAEVQDNYVKWRACDVAGNGYAESAHYRIGVDFTPVEFTGFMPAQGECQRSTDVACTVFMADPAEGAGVDLSTLEYRVALSTGPGRGSRGEWSSWTSTGMVGRDRTCEVSLTLRLAHGGGNAAQFRVSDAAGNGPTASKVYGIVVDVVGPELMRMEPGPEAKQAGRSVRLTASLRDDVSGLDVSSVEHRSSTDNGTSWTDWAPFEVSMTPDGFAGSVVLELLPGLDNLVELRARDLVGNGARFGPHRIWVNRAPVVRIASPLVGSRSVEGAPIFLDANGTVDPDGDVVAVIWYIDGTSIPYADDMQTEVRLPPGPHSVTLVAVDQDEARSSSTIEIEVVGKPHGDGGLVGIILSIILMVIVVVSLLVVVLRRSSVVSRRQ